MLCSTRHLHAPTATIYHKRRRRRGPLQYNVISPEALRKLYLRAFVRNIFLGTAAARVGLYNKTILSLPYDYHKKNAHGVVTC